MIRSPANTSLPGWQYKLLSVTTCARVALVFRVDDEAATYAFSITSDSGSSQSAAVFSPEYGSAT
jgi:hypothetical protein